MWGPSSAQINPDTCTMATRCFMQASRTCGVRYLSTSSAIAPKTGQGITARLRERAIAAGPHVVVRSCVRSHARLMLDEHRVFQALPEAADERVLRAAVEMSQTGLCRPLLLTEAPSVAYDLARSLQLGPQVEKLGIIRPDEHPNFDSLASAHAERQATLAKQRGRDANERAARQFASSPLGFANLLVWGGYTSGAVAGAVATTGATAQAALQGVGLAPGNNTLSSFFLMDFPQQWQRETLGANGTMMFADSGVVVDPTPEQLVDIALATAQSWSSLVEDVPPRVALLSFSTHGSANHPHVDKVKTATAMLQERLAQKNPLGMVACGELQVDAALVPDVQKTKAANSPLQGKPANILLFPDLDAGNIAYKMAQRLAAAQAIGPIFQGLAHPSNDLSRGCSVSDIVDAVAITILQATSKANSVFSSEVDSTAWTKLPLPEQVDPLINTALKHPLAVFAKATCPFCVGLRQVLDDLDVPYYWVEVGARPVDHPKTHFDASGELGRLVHQELIQRYGQRTVPYVFAHQELIGGYTEIMELHADGQLLPLINKTIF